MKKHSKDINDIEMRRKAVRAQRIIIIAMVVFAAVPLLAAWISGALRF